MTLSLCQIIPGYPCHNKSYLINSPRDCHMLCFWVVTYEERDHCKFWLYVNYYTQINYSIQLRYFYLQVPHWHTDSPIHAIWYPLVFFTPFYLFIVHVIHVLCSSGILKMTDWKWHFTGIIMPENKCFWSKTVKA